MNANLAVKPGVPVEIPDKPAMSLSDWLGLHHRQIDFVHKLWNYFWLATLAVYTIGGANKPLIWYLLAGYIPFALANARLIYLGQNEAHLSAIAVRSRASSANPPLTGDEHNAIWALKPWRTEIIVGGQVLLTAFVVVMLAVMRNNCGAECSVNQPAAAVVAPAQTAEPPKPASSASGAQESPPSDQPGVPPAKSP